jgi:F-type H+-transporting ATPase subunit delta
MAKASAAARDAVGEVLRRLPGIEGRRRAGLDLLALAGVLAGHTRLRAALTDPAIAPRQKVELLNGLFGERVSPAATEALAVIAERQRLHGRDVVAVVEDVAVQTLLDVAEEAGTLETVQDELFAFAGVVERDQHLRSALTDPALPPERKRAVVEDLLSQRADGVSVGLLAHWAARDRARDLPRVVDDAVAEAAARRRRVVVRVRAAVPLDAGQRARLAEAFQRVTGSPVDLRMEIDPDVVGSLSVRIGDEVFDGSVKRQLELARERFGIS